MEQYKRKLMSEYARAIVHMREQKRLKRFGLVFGAGASHDLGFPSWWELIDRIAKDEKVSAGDYVEGASGKTSLSQLLFQRYKNNLLSTFSPGDLLDRELDAHIQSGWHKVVHDALYQDVPKDIDFR